VTAVNALRDAVRRQLRLAKYVVGHDRRLLPVLVRLTPEGASKQITGTTDLVVEGFPRSGNTFTVFALRHVYGDDLSIASHVHHPGQIKEAVHRGLPCLLVVRPPVDTLASYLIAGPHGRPRQVLKEYRYYHRDVARLLDHVVVATFDQITNDLPGVVARVAQRWSLPLVPFTLSDADVDAVFERISEEHRRHHPRGQVEMAAGRPSTQRGDLNAQHRRALVQPELASLLRECEAIYATLAAAAIDTSAR
jgi:hypothetical protein